MSRLSDQCPVGTGRLPPDSMRRILILGLLLGLLTFGVLTARLWQLQILRHDELEEKALEQQTREFSSTAGRGTIYAVGGEPLAVSASVQNVALSPRDVLSLVPEGEGATGEERRRDRERKQEALYRALARDLGGILEIPEETVLRRLSRTGSAWEVLARKVEEDRADQVRELIEARGLEGCVSLVTDSRRYYPEGSLAAHVIGFVNGEDHGAYGLEAAFDRELAGESGKVLTAKNAAGTEMPTPYTALSDGVRGWDLHTTLDAGIQRYAEKALEEGIRKYEAVNGGFCVVLQPKTGAVLALASSPCYDPNQPGEILDEQLSAGLERLAQDPSVEGSTRQKAYDRARFIQWSSKCLNTAYEPGSTFKPIVMSAALEEHAVSPEDRFHCTGSMQVGGWSIRCSARAGHGSQSLQEALMNSCNPAHIVIGQRLGAETFYRYWQAFGFSDKTGIELPGESGSRFWEPEAFLGPNGITSLATASFGQRFLVNPIQLAAALSAVINGGHLMEPYLVSSVEDADGRVIRRHDPREIRRVISQETSDLVRGFMEQVVAEGTGKNAAVEGYRIGGKTGSSQTSEKDHTIVSFAGFAPADDPAFLVLLAYDCPRPAAPGSSLTAAGIPISGGYMAAPMAGELIANILRHLGYAPERADAGETVVPALTGRTLASARALLEEPGLKVRTIGDGGFVIDQFPPAGTGMPRGGTVVVQLGEAGEGPDLQDADRAAFSGVRGVAKQEVRQ